MSHVIDILFCIIEWTNSKTFAFCFHYSFQLMSAHHSRGAEIKVTVFMNMHSQSLYVELMRNIARTCRCPANNTKRWLKLPPILPTQQLCAWRYNSRLLTHFSLVWKGVRTETNDSSQQIKWVGDFFFCWICLETHAVIFAFW